MGIKFANNASTNITHALTADATSVSVTPGTGDLFPSIVEGQDYFYATLAGNNGLEIVKVTKRVLDTMTIARAQDGTDALLFNQGDLFELRIVAADFEDAFSSIDALDATAVRNKGDETIDGKKTFTSDVLINKDDPSIRMIHPKLTKVGSTHTSTEYNSIIFADKNNEALAGLRTVTAKASSGDRRIGMGLFPEGNTTDFNQLSVFYDGATDRFYGEAPSTPEGSTNKQIVTADFLQKDLTLDGSKTFTKRFTLKVDTPFIQISSPDVTKGTSPSSTLYHGVGIYDSTGFSTAKRLGVFYTNYASNGNIMTGMSAYKPENGSSTTSSIEITYPAEGRAYATAPSTPAGATGKEIVTANWLQGRGRAETITENANQDANLYVTSGFYWLKSTATNIPSGSNGLLCVWSKGNVARQLFFRQGTIDSNDHNIYTRQLADPVDGVPSKIGEWVQIITGKGGTIKTSVPRLNFADTDITRNVLPTVQENALGITFRDSENTEIGQLLYHAYNNGGAKIEMSAYNFMGSGSANMGVAYGAERGPYAYAPTPVADSNTNDIATTAWVRGKGVLVESWQSGPSWYRKYSDGWIEQGGYSTGFNTTLNLNIAHTSADYTVFMTPQSNVTPLTTVYYRNKTTTSFYFGRRQYNDGDNAQGASWMTCGY